MTVRVGAVVEGHGEVRALPILIRRICESHEVFDLHIEHPYRTEASTATRCSTRTPSAPGTPRASSRRG